jgi:hypothetical protein
MARDLNRNKNTESVLFQEKKTIREKSILPSRVHAGIAKTAQPSGLDGRGQDEYSIKTGSAGHSWAIRPRPPEAIEFGEVAAVLEVTRETATALRHSAARNIFSLQRGSREASKA